MQQTANITLEQALHNIKVVLTQYKGTLQEHQALQESFKIVNDALQKTAIEIDEKDIDKTITK